MTDPATPETPEAADHRAACIVRAEQRLQIVKDQAFTGVSGKPIRPKPDD